MKKTSLILFCMIFVGCAAHPFEGWSKADTYRQIASTALVATDWMQTREIATNDQFTEQNPILGEYPTTKEVDIYMGVSILLQTLISGALAPEYRQYWQYGTIVGRAICVGHNYSIGVRF